MAKHKYIKPSAIKALVKAQSGKRVSSSFLLVLDAYVEKKVILASQLHNGGAKTVGVDSAGYSGIR